MIIDDNPLSVEGIEKNINWAKLDAEVTQIHYNGKSALHSLETVAIDIIISDIEMPDLDGISMSKNALAINPFIKILLISAYDKFEYAKSALQLGIFDYIEKPIDYEYLSKQISNAIELINQEHTKAMLIEQSRPIMIKKFYSELLHSSNSESQYKLSSYENYLELSFDYNFFVTILFELQNMDDIKKKITIPQFEMILYNLQDTINEHTKIFDFCYIIKELDSFTVIICQNSSNPNHISESLYKIAESIALEYNTNNMPLNISIGNIVRDIWKLNLSYKSARQALEYRFFFPQKNIFDAKEALNQDYSLKNITSSNDDELIKLICQKNEVEIKIWIKYFQAELAECNLPRNLYFIKIHSLLGKLLKFLYELNLDTTELQNTILKKYSILESFSTTDDLFTWLNDICILVSQSINASLTTYHNQLCNSVINYIIENYSSSDLCLNELAKHVNVSPAYLSALFKKTKNYSIIDAITNIRIDAACQLLKTTTLSLKDISEKCGYANQYYFSTTFKKKKSKTPSAYREDLDINN